MQRLFDEPGEGGGEGSQAQGPEERRGGKGKGEGEGIGKGEEEKRLEAETEEDSAEDDEEDPADGEVPTDEEDEEDAQGLLPSITLSSPPITRGPAAVVPSSQQRGNTDEEETEFEATDEEDSTEDGEEGHADGDDDDSTEDDEEAGQGLPSITPSRLITRGPIAIAQGSPSRRSLASMAPHATLTQHRPRARSNSIDGVFVLDDDDPRITPRRVTSEIPSEFPFPSGAINGELYNVLEHTVAYQGSQDVDMGGRIIEEVLEDDAPAPAESTRQRGKRPADEAPPYVLPPKRLHPSGPQQDLLISLSDLNVVSPPLRYEGVDVLELELVKTNREITNADDPLTSGLFDSFTDGDRMFMALQLVATISSPAAAPVGELTGAIPFNSHVTAGSDQLTPTNQLPDMIMASRRALRFLHGVPVSLSLLRLKTIMCYITMYLTLEHSIVPKLRADNPDWPPRHVDSEKHRHFYELLNGDGDLNIPMTKVRDNTGFGRTFWRFGQELGVAALLMLAVAEQGLTIIGRACGPRSSNIPNLASALSSSRAWWSFAHAIGPPTFRTLFGLRSVSYTVPQLLHYLRTEPMPAASVAAIHEACRTAGINTDPYLPAEGSVESPELVLQIGEVSISVKRHPNGILLPRQVERRNLWEWLATASDRAMGDGSGITRAPFAVFKNLFPESHITTDLVDYFCRIYNRKSIPGRKAACASFIPDFVEIVGPETNIKQLFESLAEPSQPACEVIVCPIDFETATLGLVISKRTESVRIYNWIDDEKHERLRNDALMVCSLLRP